VSPEKDFRTVEWREGKVVLLDQTALPSEERYLEIEDWRELADAIRTMKVRGAPAIGIAAAFGLALAASRGRDPLREVEAAYRGLASTRPTAVNLFWALDRVMGVVREGNAREVAERALEEARAVAAEQDAADRAIGGHGAELLPEGARVLTHCNAGGLATYSFGTALGVIKAAHRRGKNVFVWVDETRPLLQGARLTAWELQREGVPMAVVCDNMAGHLMAREEVDAVVVGADRVAANGDTANKIGTYTLAVLAARHRVPFYVAAPLSTLDLDIAEGSAIPIEERSPEEIVDWGGRRIAPPGASARNFAFDVTPAELISAIVTERGVARPPYEDSLRRLAEET
jgi:methylthioribose-1-phosphate isomerase